ncbi:MAG: GIY-YIG nuclease family protein [Chloroflexi bacterium]|nr:GIY-YIG nuclease family protein [Ardenticatenaceae bacterium]MBL1129495.1 GIY-YIG nuclease family protein [Chloroflexota bacterium]NOG35577.1 GIY-YIG nuclease family protein [Chloroflexota bacterium]GIK58736.1 MAG: hypothetical protein BroJett015_43990 [Chloroflexota bacterium]
MNEWPQPLQPDDMWLNSPQLVMAKFQPLPQIDTDELTLALPKGKGSYALLLRLNQAVQLQIGRLGRWPFAAGYYLYLGSALGSGGLAARLRRHLSPTERPFWHIDYLRRQAVVTAVWIQEGPVRLECAWATRAAQWPGAAIPVPRFGASDCRCAAHLVYRSSGFGEIMPDA